MSKNRTTHRLKQFEHFFNAQLLGYKNYEIRHDDRDFRTGDLIELIEIKYPRVSNVNIKTGRTLFLEITGVLSEFPGIEDGFIILSTKHANV